MKEPIRILHIITSLEHGGAQFLASKLILNKNNSYIHSVYVLLDKGPYKEKLIQQGIEVISSNSSNFFLIFKRLVSCYLINRPDIVHTWMYHSDLIGLILSFIFNKHKLIWSIHHSDPLNNKFFTKLVIKICKLFALFIPNKIIACSEIALKNHANYGYPLNKMEIIHNGIDFEKFSNTKNNSMQYNFNKDIVVGHIARWHKIKGHKFFLEMASKLNKTKRKFTFLMIGTGINWSNNELVSLLKKYELIDCVELLGEQSNINKLLNRMDIFISSSINESFSLTLVEAIACRVPSISSDTGIAREALSSDLFIVDIGNSVQLTEAVDQLLSMPSKKILKIVDESYRKSKVKFNEKTMFDNYYSLYKSILSEK